MNKKLFYVLLKKNLFTFFIHPQVYLSTIILTVFSVFCFLITQNLDNFFFTIPYVSILLVPFLVMCIRTKKFDSLLPASSLQILFVIWLSVLIVFFIQLIPLFLCLFAFSFFYVVDFYKIFCVFFGIILYFSASSAISIFIFEVFKNIAFLLSAFILAVFNFSHTLFFYAKTPDFFASLLKSISLSWHFNSFEKGIIDTRDVFFFLLLSFVSIIFAAFFAEKRKGSNYSKKTVLLFVLFVALIFGNFSHYYVRFDVSKTKKNSLSLYSKNLLKQFDEPIQISFYSSKELSKLYPNVKNVFDFLSEYERVSKKVNLNFSTTDNDKTKDQLLKYNILPQQFRKSKDENDFTEVYSAIVLEYLDKVELIPFILSSDSLEYELSVRFNRLLSGQKKAVYVLCANDLTLSQDYSYVIPYLEAQGFDCIELNLEKKTLNLDNFDNVLVLLGSSNLTENQACEIETFAMNGGKILAFTSPFSIKIKNDWSVAYNKNDNFIKVLSALGFEFNKQMILDYEENNKIVLIDENNKKKLINYPYWIRANESKVGDSATFFWTSPIVSYTNSIESIFKTSTTSFALDAKKELKNGESSLLETNPLKVSEKKIFPMTVKNNYSYVVGAHLKGSGKGYFSGLQNKNAEVILISDQYFLTSLMIGYISDENYNYNNFYTLTSLLLKLYNEKELLKLYKKSIAIDESFVAKNENVSQNSIYFLSKLFFITLIALAILIRTALGVYRKKNYAKID